MGIKHLNQFLKKECNEAIESIKLSSLSGKKIVIDTSIYLYKFIVDGEESLIENVLTMLNLFRYYKIIPIFIFDGEVPTEKKALIEKRKECKKSAEKEYYLLKDSVEVSSVEKKKGIHQQMEQLKKKFVYIRREQIETVKKIFDIYGTDYMVAEGEADELCADLVLNGTAWACLSEDMDMFVYGVPRILRYLSFTHHNVVLYDLTKILHCLCMSQDELRDICVLSGTDYSIQDTDTDTNTFVYDLYTVLSLFQKYKNENVIVVSFYEWLKNTKRMDDLLFDKSLEIKKRFEIKKIENQYDYKCKKNICQKNDFIKEKLAFLLKMNGFLY